MVTCEVCKSEKDKNVPAEESLAGRFFFFFPKKKVWADVCSRKGKSFQIIQFSPPSPPPPPPLLHLFLHLLLHLLFLHPLLSPLLSFLAIFFLFVQKILVRTTLFLSSYPFWSFIGKKWRIERSKPSTLRRRTRENQENQENN